MTQQNQQISVPPGFNQITSQIQSLNINKSQISQKLINRLKSTLNDEEQKMFLDSFIGYLKYDQEKDFVVDLDNVWQWIGYSKKDKAKDSLIKNFEENIEFIIKKPAYEQSQPTPSHQGVGGSGILKEQILMTVDCFKEFCTEAHTSQGKKCRKYYIKMERCMQDQIKEDALHTQIEMDETKNLYLESQKRELELKSRELKLLEENNSYKVKYESKEKTQNVYIGQGIGINNQKYKVGFAIDPKRRKQQQSNPHSDGFEHIYVQQCIDQIELENWIKYILNEQKYHHQNEFYNCGLNHIKTVYKLLGVVQDELIQARQYISEQELITRILTSLGYNITINENREIIIDQQEQEQETFSIQQQKDDFTEWFDNNITYREKSFIVGEDLIKTIHKDLPNLKSQYPSIQSINKKINQLIYQKRDIFKHPMIYDKRIIKNEQNDLIGRPRCLINISFKQDTG